MGYQYIVTVNSQVFIVRQYGQANGKYKHMKHMKKKLLK